MYVQFFGHRKSRVCPEWIKDLQRVVENKTLLHSELDRMSRDHIEIFQKLLEQVHSDFRKVRRKKGVDEEKGKDMRNKGKIKM